MLRAISITRFDRRIRNAYSILFFTIIYPIFSYICLLRLYQSCLDNRGITLLEYSSYLDMLYVTYISLAA